MAEVLRHEPWAMHVLGLGRVRSGCRAAERRGTCSVGSLTSQLTNWRSTMSGCHRLRSRSSSRTAGVLGGVSRACGQGCRVRGQCQQPGHRSWKLAQGSMAHLQGSVDDMIDLYLIAGHASGS